MPSKMLTDIPGKRKSRSNVSPYIARRTVSATHAARSAYWVRDCDLRVDRMEADVENPIMRRWSQAQPTRLPIMAKACTAGARTQRDAQVGSFHKHTTHWIARIGCSSLMKCRKPFQVLRISTLLITKFDK